MAPAPTNPVSDDMNFIKKAVTKLNNAVVEFASDRVEKNIAKKTGDAAGAKAFVDNAKSTLLKNATVQKGLNRVANIGTATVITAAVLGAGAAAGAGAGGAGAAGAGAGGAAGGGASGAAAAVGAVGSGAAAISKLASPTPQQVEPENFYEENNAVTPTSEGGGGGGLIAAALALLLLK